MTTPATPNSDKFWMVFVEGRNAPKHRHPTLESANNEAYRLALTTLDKVYVLETISLHAPSNPIINYIPL